MVSLTQDATAALAAIRTDIEALDDELVTLIGRRCRLAAAAGEAKRHAGLPGADLPREAAVLRRAAARARAEAVDEEATRRIFWHLIDLGRRAQTGSATP